MLNDISKMYKTLREHAKKDRVNTVYGIVTNF